MVRQKPFSVGVATIWRTKEGILCHEAQHKTMQQTVFKGHRKTQVRRTSFSSEIDSRLGCVLNKMCNTSRETGKNPARA